MEGITAKKKVTGLCYYTLTNSYYGFVKVKPKKKRKRAKKKHGKR